ncbi:unnamed protein product [Microthlaspi erraticum]|uniref:F-box domain-containing protein n=1 Tax=Microthlaspi erraticum TaxID=1685480 RepID=A0A6D2HX64_9BRAS|nr:unnamed protein product [Microthlaspi erraticum]
MAMISDLPRELREDIVLRLPFESLRALRLTCKKWDTLLKSRRLTKMHFEKAAATAARERESQMIMLMDHNLYLKSVVFDVDPSIKHRGKLTCLGEQVKISRVFHCDGLLLCKLRDNNNKVVVWNPYTGQTRWIGPRRTQREEKGTNIYMYALGYVNKRNKSRRRSYKILKIVYEMYSIHCHRVFYEIYDVDSGLWRTLDIPERTWYVNFDDISVSLKGNTYWCAIGNVLGPREHLVICFDYTRKRFGPLMQLPFTARKEDHVTLSCVREEKLAVSLQRQSGNPCRIEIWITTKIDTRKLSWSKFLTRDMEQVFDCYTYIYFPPRKR